MQRNQQSCLRLFSMAFLLSLTPLLVTGCAQSGFGNIPWIDGSRSTTKPSATTTLPPVTTTPQSMQTTPQATLRQAKVALLLPLTGKGSDTGQAMMNAAQLAMFDLNASSLFELMPFDTGEGATTAAQQAINNGANIILGPLFSDDAKIIAPLAQQKNISIISFSTDVTAASASTYLMGFMPHTQVEQIMMYAASQKKSRIALITPRNVYGDSVTSSFSSITRRYNIQNAGVIRYNNGGSPSASELEMLKNADAVLIATPALEANKISNALNTMGLSPTQLQRLGTGLWDQADAAKLSGLQGAWYAASSPRMRSRFESRYFETYGSQAPRIASLAYDATALAVVLAKSGRGFGRDALTNPNGFFGIDGVFRFEPNGLAERGLAILAIQNGASQVLLDAPQRFASQ